MVSPLLDYMPGVRNGIIVDLPRRHLAFGRHVALAHRLRAQGYGLALVMPRTWKSALAVRLAGIPQRTGFVGEGRFGLINDLRWGERRLPRMVDRCAALALPKRRSPTGRVAPKPDLIAPQAGDSGVAPPTRPHQYDWPYPRSPSLAPGAVGPSKRWPAASFAEFARRLTSQGHRVWIVGGPGERALAAEIAGTGNDAIRDLTGPDLRNAILALAAADAAVSNDSGLLHVAAALRTPAIGIFGPTSPFHWAPLNPLAGVIETPNELSCRPCHKPVCAPGHHLCMRNITVEQIMAATQAAITGHRTARG